jgi:L-aspartate oxidase
MAARIGASIADPEFMQFHPTAIDIGRDPAPLATESLRGEGARLIDKTGAPFMTNYHPRGDLAPRDVVARALHQQIRDGKGAFLDARQAVGAHFPEAFPTVFAACMSAGIDPRVAPIPVAPATHYHMGGVQTDLWGATSAPHLSAVGECASTGAHGANRLASNSLLESVVFAARIAERLRDARLPAAAKDAHADMPAELSAQGLTRLRALMADHLGVVRDAADRAAACAGVRKLIAEHGLTNELLASAMIAEGAAWRQESRGAHYCPDHPQTAAKPKRTFLTIKDLALLSDAPSPAVSLSL